MNADLPPILNTGSLNISIGELADGIAAFHGVPVVDKGNSTTYSFRMNCGKIQSSLRRALGKFRLRNVATAFATCFVLFKAAS